MRRWQENRGYLTCRCFLLRGIRAEQFVNKIVAPVLEEMSLLFGVIFFCSVSSNYRIKKWLVDFSGYLIEICEKNGSAESAGRRSILGGGENNFDVN